MKKKNIAKKIKKVHSYGGFKARLENPRYYEETVSKGEKFIDKYGDFK